MCHCQCSLRESYRNNLPTLYSAQRPLASGGADGKGTKRDPRPRWRGFLHCSILAENKTLDGSEGSTPDQVVMSPAGIAEIVPRMRRLVKMGGVFSFFAIGSNQ